MTKLGNFQGKCNTCGEEMPLNHLETRKKGWIAVWIYEKGDWDGIRHVKSLDFCTEKCLKEYYLKK